MAEPKKSPTMLEVGRMAGCHPSTVSLALRGDARIPLKTQARVKAAAARLGYRVHPMISAWVSARRAGRPYQNRLAAVFLNCLPADYNWRSDHHFRSIYEGAREQAECYGFSLDVLQWSDYARDVSRLNKILLTRSVQGIIVGPKLDHHDLIGIDWNRFALVSVGYALREPALHRVTEDHHLGMKLAFDFCLRNGRRRIGLALVRHHNAMRRERWISAFLHEQFQNLRVGDRLPIYEPKTDAPISEAASWIRKNKPDILLVDDPPAWRGAGVETLGFALAVVRESAGVRENNQGVGRHAADLLVSLMLRNERGIPAMRQTVMVEPSFTHTRQSG